MTTQVPTFFLTNQQKLLALSTKYIQNLTTLHITYLAAAAAKSLQSCLTLRPHRRQLTRLSCPWDSPGKNTGVACHCLPRTYLETWYNSNYHLSHLSLGFFSHNLLTGLPTTTLDLFQSFFHQSSQSDPDNLTKVILINVTSVPKISQWLLIS